MNTPDWHRREVYKDEQAYSASIDSAEQDAEAEAYEIAQGQAVYNAIRKLTPNQLTHKVVRQILETLACQMDAAGFNDLEVATIEQTAEDF